MIARDSENKIKDSISSTVRQLHRQDGAHGIGIFSKVFFNHTESWSERERERLREEDMEQQKEILTLYDCATACQKLCFILSWSSRLFDGFGTIPSFG